LKTIALNTDSGMISVIIPTRGRPFLLQRAVASVLAQSITDFELLIVVDGEDPDTIGVLNAIPDQRIRIIQNHHSLGSAMARNEGIKDARGDWIAFLDDDDAWTFDKLAIQFGAARALNNCTIISCLSYVITPLQRYTWPTCPFDGEVGLDDYLFDRRSWFRGNSMLQCSSLFMSRQLCLDLMFRPIHDDWDMLLRAVKIKGAKLVTINSPLVFHYTEDERHSLGASFDWRLSLCWADDNRMLLSSRAYAGFCLTVIAPQAAKADDYRAFFILLYCAVRNGSPRLIQIVLFLAIWIIPMRRRQQMRSLWQRRKKVVRDDQQVQDDSSNYCDGAERSQHLN
jgi:glycosyltransferase involved in cell wall biosynthesis